MTDQSATTRKKHQELIFQNEFEKLNEKQKQAVTHIEGPLFVLAGPGTGKTQILAMRIGYILQQTDTQPHNILCLTYTDAGAIAMRKRLIEFIGPTAYNLHIYTFHAFTNQVIRENMHFFGGIKELQPLTDLEKSEVFFDLIDRIPPDNPLKRFKGSVYYDKKPLESLFNDMKSEGWTTEFVKTKIDEYLENLRDDPDMYYKRRVPTKEKVYEKGDFKEKDFWNIQEKMTKLSAAADQFEVYEELLKTKGRYDYDDMILWVLRAFEQFPQLLLKYQEQYLYFLVDEYQDTNGAQNKILEKLIDYWENPNVFAVGDDDQAIYRFQGANMENILHFIKALDPEVIVLNSNYRSSQLIVDASAVLIDNNEQRLSRQLQIDKQFFAAGDNAQYPNPVRIVAYPNISQQEAAIYWEIKKMKEENYPLNQVAVIYRNHKQVEDLTKALEAASLPVNIRKKVDLLTEPFIMNILEMLQLVDSELKDTGWREDLLFRTLVAPVFDVRYADTLKISRAAAYNTKTKEKKFWIEIISDKDKLIELGVREVEKISGIFDKLSNWVIEAPKMTVQSLFEKVINETGILHNALSAPDCQWKIQMLTSLFDFIKSESVRNPYLKLADLMDSIDKMKQSGISLPLVKVVSSSDGVHFITAHSAKGLQFRKVFILGANKDQWEQKRSGNNGFSYPPNILSANSENNEEDERRVFFVAATRAEQELTISYADAKDDGKEIECSRFVTELKDSTECVKQSTSIPDDNALIQYKVNILQEMVLPPHEWIDKNLIDNILENYELNVTDLNKYLRCPISFYYENIIMVPSARTANAGFGNAIHHALEQFFKDAKTASPKGFGPGQLLVDKFNTGMRIYRSHFTDKEFERLSYHGADILTKYHADQLKSWFAPEDYLMEQYISNVHFKNIPIKGKIDKIEFYKDTVHVIDYKTGNPKDAKTKVRPPKNETDPGGDNWRQIMFYKILIDNDPKNRWIATSGEINLIEPEHDNSFSRHKFVFNPDEVYIVENQLIEVFQKIKDHEFSKGCGEENCQWCNFVKNRNRMK